MTIRLEATARQCQSAWLRLRGLAARTRHPGYRPCPATVAAPADRCLRSGARLHHRMASLSGPGSLPCGAAGVRPSLHRHPCRACGGDQRAIQGEFWRVFARTGTTHLMSISGLHVTMVAALVAGLVGTLWRRVPRLMVALPAQRAAVLAGWMAALAYALLSGFQCRRSEQPTCSASRR